MNKHFENISNAHKHQNIECYHKNHTIRFQIILKGIFIEIEFSFTSKMCINAHVGDMKLMLSMDKYNESEKGREKKKNRNEFGTIF